jgi:hypothetical protein
MNTSRLTLLLAILAVIGVTFSQSAGDYILDWSTIDGGGGQSSGGQYVLTGTIGQPDAGEGGLAPGKRIGDGLDLMLKPL